MRNLLQSGLANASPELTAITSVITAANTINKIVRLNVPPIVSCYPIIASSLGVGSEGGTSPRSGLLYTRTMATKERKRLGQKSNI